MPQISISVTQEVYDDLKRCVTRHGESSVAGVVRKLVTVYARGIVFFRGAFPDINRGKLTDLELEVFQGEDPEAEDKVVAPVDISQVPPIDWDAVSRMPAKAEEKK